MLLGPLIGFRAVAVAGTQGELLTILDHNANGRLGILVNAEDVEKILAVGR